MLELCHVCNMSEGLDPFGHNFENFVTKPSSKSLVVIDKAHQVVFDTAILQIYIDFSFHYTHTIKLSRSNNFMGGNFFNS